MSSSLTCFLAAVLLVGAGAGQTAQAGSTTFYRDVAPILYEHCASCHRPAGAAPFPLLELSDARKRSRQIVDVTRTGYMPPWLPERGEVEFVDERGLTDAERSTLAAWVAAGEPAGDRGGGPPPPGETNGWELGEPDLVVAMPEPFVVPAEGFDLFRNFVIPVEVERPRWVRSFEFRPGNPRVVHHAVMNFDRTGSSRRLDERDPGLGFEGMVASGLRSFDGHFVAWTPGNRPSPGTNEIAWRLEPGTDLVLQLHMLPTGKPEPIRAELALHFTDEAPQRTPLLLRLGSKTIDIPAGAADYTIEDDYRVPVDLDVLAIYPHAHYLGKRMEAWAELPDRSRKTLIRIVDWDFSWQDDYEYVEPIALPAGSRIGMRYVYDNSESNPRNPRRPPRRVLFGPESTDEMGDLWIQVAPRVPEELALLRQDFERKDVLAHIDGYEKLLRSFPRHVDYLTGVALLLLRVGRSDEAEARLQAAVALDPDDPDAHHALGLLRQAQGRLPQAIDHYRRALAAQPDRLETRNNLGVALRATGEVDAAIAAYRAVLRVEPNHARAHANLGVALHSRGDLATAIEHYTSALALESDSARAHYNLAAALEEAGRSSEAIAGLRRALELAPDFAPAHRRLADLLLGDGRPEEALPFARRAVELSGERDPKALRSLASTLASAGRLDAAAEVVRRALDLSPDAELAGALRDDLAAYSAGRLPQAPR